MDPISLAMGTIGFGMQIFGGFAAAKTAHEQAGVSADEAKQEQGINDTKQQAMELNARRTQLENIRNNQRARAMAENTSVNQGAQFGTGIQGGLAQVDDQTMFNMAGVNNAVQTGRQINAFNQNITQDKYRMASLGGQMATDQGIASLGGAMLKAGPMVGQLTSTGWGALKNSNMGQGLFGGGTPSGYGNG